MRNTKKRSYNNKSITEFIQKIMQPLLIITSSEKLLKTNRVIFWGFSMLYLIVFSTQVKRSVIINYKHSIYKLPHRLPNDLRLKILGN